MELEDKGQIDQTISDILRGMQHAVNSAQESLQDSQLRFIERYFDPTTGEPYFCLIKLPNGKTIHVPEMSLIPQNTLLLDEIEMSFAVRVASSEVKSSIAERPHGLKKLKDKFMKKIEIKRTSLGVFFGNSKNEKDSLNQNENSVGPATDVIQIKIRFKATDEPEGTARIRDMLNKTISD